MADYYETATVYPTDLQAAWFEPQELELLTESGFEREETDGRYYFYVPEGVCPPDDEDQYLSAFQNAIRRSNGKITEIVIEGAMTCTKYRPGAFGGFVIRITEDKMQTGSTTDLLELMRVGPWDNSQP